ncbi:MAG: hypothetical protein ABH851_08995 [Methanobacteriota archaeon]
MQSPCELGVVVDDDYFQRAVEAGIITPLEGGNYNVPMRVPTLGGDESQHKRSVHTHSKGVAFILLGVGEKGKSELAFEWDSDPIQIHPFRGGLRLPGALRRIEKERELRGAFHSAEGEDFMDSARTYGVADDMFMHCIAVFKPLSVPRIREGELVLAGHGEALSQAGVPHSAIEEHRILLYAANLAERTREFPPVSEGIENWDRVFSYYGFDLRSRYRMSRLFKRNLEVKDRGGGELVPFDESAARVLNGSAARYSVFNRLVHERLHACASDFRIFDDGEGTSYYVGGIFQDRNPNVNPLNIFDVGHVFGYQEFKKYKIHGGRVRSRDVHCFRDARRRDNSGAKKMVAVFGEKLGIDPLQALKVYDQIYPINLQEALENEDFKTLESYR